MDLKRPEVVATIVQQWGGGYSFSRFLMKIVGGPPLFNNKIL